MRMMISCAARRVWIEETAPLLEDEKIRGDPWRCLICQFDLLHCCVVTTVVPPRYVTRQLAGR